MVCGGSADRFRNFLKGIYQVSASVDELYMRAAGITRTPERAVKNVAAPHVDRVELPGGLTVVPARPRYLPYDSTERKNYPMVTGLLDYFPDALAAVAELSKYGNDKHNPGEPLHWARGKSMDHADCIVRHLVERGRKDPEGNLHSAQIAWRALALLQEELELAHGLAVPRGTTGAIE